MHQNFTTAASLSFWLIGLTSRIKKQFFRLIRKIPFVGMAVSISGKSVPSFSSRCALTLMSHSWMTVQKTGGGGVRPLAHLSSCTDDSIRLLLVIVSLAECRLSGFIKTSHKKLILQWICCQHLKHSHIIYFREGHALNWYRMSAPRSCL